MFRLLRSVANKIPSTYQTGIGLARPSIAWSAIQAKTIFTGTPKFAVEVTKPAPDFKSTAVVNGAFKEIKLSDYKGKYVVLFFYPLDFHLAWINTPRKKGGLGSLNIPLLSDFTKTIAKDYGVLLEAGMALRGTFIIDPKGTVRHASVNDLPIGRSVEETLRLLKAIQFVEKHGEVCPANWKPDSPTIKPDPKNAMEYFEKMN